MKKTSVTRLRGGGVQANLVVQLFNLEVYQSSLPNFEGRLYLQSWERYKSGRDHTGQEEPQGTQSGEGKSS